MRVVYNYIVSLIIFNYMKEAEFQYTLEHKAVKWSPLVSNLHMGHIRVVFAAFWLACLID